MASSVQTYDELEEKWFTKFEEDVFRFGYRRNKEGNLSRKKKDRRRTKPYCVTIAMSRKALILLFGETIMKQNPKIRVHYGTIHSATLAQAEYEGLLVIEQLIKDLKLAQSQSNPDIPQYQKQWLHRHHFTMRMSRVISIRDVQSVPNWPNTMLMTLSFSS